MEAAQDALKDALLVLTLQHAKFVNLCSFSILPIFVNLVELKLVWYAIIISIVQHVFHPLFVLFNQQLHTVLNVLLIVSHVFHQPNVTIV